MSTCYDHTTVLRPPTVVRALALLAMTLAATICAHAQSASSFGRRFVVAFPDTTQSHVRLPFSTLQPSVTLTLASLDTARVTISSPGYLRTVTVVPDRSTVVSLTDAATRAPKIFVDSVNRPVGTTFEIRADRPVSVTAYFTTLHGSEAYTPIPVERWGREYLAATLSQWFVYNALQTEEKYTYVPAPAALVVVASEANTEVTIESPTFLVGPPTRTVMLGAGQAYLVETGFPSRLDSLTIPDLSGTRITATKPIGVLSGTTRTVGSPENPLPADPLPSNAMSNAAFEWLHPVEAHGHTFVYRQFSAIDELTTTELIRVYATAPGLTTVTTTNGGPPMSVPQGRFIEFSSKPWRTTAALQPFAVRTDRPAQVFVTTASTAKLVGTDPSSGVELESNTWSPAMAELVPRERWITFGRYGAPEYPGGTSHFLVIAADSGTTVLLDGERVAFETAPVAGTTYRQVRVEVAPGDHTLRAANGRFTATAFGQRRGYAAFRPFGANDQNDPFDGVAMHPTYYLEELAVSYAMPVPGTSDFTPPADSLDISRLERCDSTVVTANRTTVTWSSGIIDAEVDPGSANLDVTIEKTFIERLHLGFRIRFEPIDADRDARGSVTVSNENGQRWSIPYSYRAHTVELAPTTIAHLAIPSGELLTTPLTLTNRKPFTTTILDARLRHGDRGFTLNGRSALPKPLAAGGSVGLSLDFTGAVAGAHYEDTLVIHADCDSLVVPLSARTAPPVPAPLPLITGYDWRVRRVGSVNDTLTFVSNAGTLPFAIDRIVIANDPAGAFAVGSAASPAVDPAAITSAPITFTPPFAGDFAAEIILVTTDGDSARAELRGRAELARIDVPEIVPLELCVGGIVDTALVIGATGTLASRIDSFVVIASPNVRVELDTAWMSLPRMLAPSEELVLPVRVTGLGAGVYSVSVVAHAAAIGDSAGEIRGTIAACTTPGVSATDHDFDTVLITRTRAGTVTITNTGEGDIVVAAMRIVDDASAAFRVLAPAPPFTIAEGATVIVDVDFTPPGIGPWTARVEYETSAGVVHSTLRGVGARIVIPAHIPRHYRGEPGQSKTFVVELTRVVAIAGSGPIPISVGYDTTLLDFVGVNDSIAHQGPVRLVTARRGVIELELAPDGDSLHAAPIAALDFLVRIAVEDSSELPLDIVDVVPWIEFETAPGLFVREPWCGLYDRLFEFTVGAMALRPVRPNPVRGDAVVDFGVPVDGHVRLVVVDALGRERLLLVDDVRSAGEHVVALPASVLPRGAYLVRLATSGMERVERFVVE